MIARSIVGALGFVGLMAALVAGGYLAVTSLGDGMMGEDPAVESVSGALILRVSGTPGTSYSGTYTAVGGTNNATGVVTATPKDYELPGGVAGVNVVSVDLQRQGTTGELKAEILEDGQVVQTAQTTATNPAVSLTYSP